MITVNNAVFTAKKYFEKETKDTRLENIEPKIKKVYDAKSHFIFAATFDVSELNIGNHKTINKMVAVNKNSGGIQELHGASDYWKCSVASRVLFDSEKQDLEDFLKYAKFEFDADISPKKTNDADTFEKIFGGTFEDRKR